MKDYKDKTLEELRTELAELDETRDALMEEIESKELAGYDYTGKFINIPYYGSMFVTWQQYALYHGDKRMFFQGFMFNGCSCPYLEDFYLTIDAKREWYIPIGTFKDIVRNNEIKVMEKEDFLKGIMQCVSECSENICSMLDQSIDSIKTDK